MELYLMQHGACFSREVNPEEPLSPVGRDQVAHSALGMAALGLSFDAVFSSPKKRALETARIVAEATGFPLSEIKTSEVFKPMAPAEDSIEFLRAYKDLSAVFLAGHLPSLGEIISLCVTSGGKVGVQIENGGLTRVDILDFNRPAGTLMWRLAPRHLHLLARV